jgi:hypothetical protein
LPLGYISNINYNKDLTISPKDPKHQIENAIPSFLSADASGTPTTGHPYLHWGQNHLVKRGQGTLPGIPQRASTWRLKKHRMKLPTLMRATCWHKVGGQAWATEVVLVGTTTSCLPPPTIQLDSKIQQNLYLLQDLANIEEKATPR